MSVCNLIAENVLLPQHKFSIKSTASKNKLADTYSATAIVDSCLFWI